MEDEALSWDRLKALGQKPEKARNGGLALVQVDVDSSLQFWDMLAGKPFLLSLAYYAWP